MLRHIQPVKRVGAVAKWEGIVIDPIGAVAAVLVYEAVYAGTPASAAIALAKTLLVGTVLGLLTAAGLIEPIRRHWIPDFLHSPVFLAVTLCAFTISNLVAHESGLVTVTILGIALANQRRVPVRHMLEFKENLRLLLISCLFIVLAARIKPQDLIGLSWPGLIFLAAMILVVRPVSVFASTIGTELKNNERLFLSFLAPRGIVAAAVSSVFALQVGQLSEASEPRGRPEQIVAVTFLVIVGTVAAYGLCAPALARRLKLAVPNPQGILFAGSSSWIRSLAKLLQNEGFAVLLVDTNFHNVARARLAGLPAQCNSILSEYVSDELDLTGIGRLIAATPNDDLNSLAALEFSSLFGRAKVYQLFANEAAAGKADAASHRRGRLLFGNGLTHSELAFRFAAGAQLKKTRITEEYEYGDFLARYGPNSVLLFVINENNQLLINSIDEPLKPRAGQTVIALVEAAEKSPEQPATMHAKSD